MSAETIEKRLTEDFGALAFALAVVLHEEHPTAFDRLRARVEALASSAGGIYVPLLAEMQRASLARRLGARTSAEDDG